jgi:hypothetical protein
MMHYLHNIGVEGFVALLARAVGLTAIQIITEEVLL